MNDEERYRIGELVFYYESGNKNLVRILANLCDDKYLRYKLEILGTSGSSLPVRNTNDDKFECEKPRHPDPGCDLWQLKND